MKVFSGFFRTRRGSALLIVLGFLSFLLISAVSFAIYMRVERAGTSNFRHAVMARQLINVAFADARDSVEAVLTENKSEYWPAFYKDAPYDRVLVSVYEPASVAALLDPELIRHVPPALVREVMDNRKEVCWKAAISPDVVVKEPVAGVVAGTSKAWSGRYAWMAVNVSDMLDINAAGTTNDVRGVGVSGRDLLLCQNDAAVDFVTDKASAKALAEDRAAQLPAALFMTGADLVSAAQDSDYFRPTAFKWEQVFSGGGAAQANSLTIYSRYLAEEAASKTDFEQAIFCDELVPAEIKIGDSGSDPLDAKLRHALAKGGFPQDNDAYLRMMIKDYLDDDSIPFGDKGNQHPMAMILPNAEAVPMVSEIAYQSPAPALFGNQIFTPIAKDSTTCKGMFNSAGNGFSLKLNLVMGFPYNRAFKKSGEKLEVEAYWTTASAGAPGSVARGMLQVEAAPNLPDFAKGENNRYQTLQTVTVKLPVGEVTAEADKPLFADLYFRMSVGSGERRLDDLPTSYVSRSSTAKPTDGTFNPLGGLGHVGERFFRLRYVFRLELIPGDDPTYKAVLNPGDTECWPMAGVWEVADPRYNWYSPASQMGNPGVVANFLNSTGAAGNYNAERSSVHWFFRTSDSSTSGNEMGPLAKRLIAARKDIDVDDNNGKQVLFVCNDAGRISTADELGFLPRPPYLATGQNNDAVQGFMKTLRTYDYSNDTKADSAFLRQFVASRRPRRGLVHLDTPNEDLVIMALAGMPRTVLEAIQGKSDGGGNDPYADLADAVAAKLIAQNTPGSRATRFLAPWSFGYRRTMANGFSEVDRKAFAVMAQDIFARRQQLILYILRADAYTAFFGQGLSDGDSLASCRAVALVWRDPFHQEFESMAGGGGVPIGPGNPGGGDTVFNKGEVPHDQRVVYFQIVGQ